jgi:hypothetical protein
VQCRVGVECFPQLVVPLFREQYRLVDNSILLVCLGRSVEYAGPQRMHRAQRQKKACQSLCIDKTHDSQNRLVSLNWLSTGPDVL